MGGGGHDGSAGAARAAGARAARGPAGPGGGGEPGGAGGGGAARAPGGAAPAPLPQRRRLAEPPAGGRLECVRGCCSGEASSSSSPGARHVPLGVRPPEDVERVRALALGPHSEVWEGAWRAGGARVPVAVKAPCLPTSASLDAFHRELGVLLRLRGRPNVVQLLGAAAHPPDYAFVLGLEAGSLADLGALRGRNLLGCALQAARGLREVHRLGVLHRDVKPGNFLQSPDAGREGGLAVRLADFGLAGPPEEEPLGGGSGGCGPSASRLSCRRLRGRRGGEGADRGAGTLEYMAPEVLLRRRASFPADVYSLGVTLNELAAGARPFEGAEKERPGCHTVLEVGYGRAELAAAVATHGLRPDLAFGAPAAFLDLVGRCWRMDPGERPGMDEVVQVLERLYQLELKDGEAGSGPTPASSPPLSGPRTPEGSQGEPSAMPPPGEAEKAAAPQGLGAPALPAGSASGAPSLEAGVFQTQGRREHQEDRCLLAGAAADGRRLVGEGCLAGATSLLVGVFDGHRGHEAAEFASREMEAEVGAALGAREGVCAGDALRTAFLAVDRRFRASSTGTLGGKRFPGTTALVALVLGDRLHVANAGDCRALLGSRGGATRALSTDHCTANVAERRRVEAAGGLVVHRVDTWRVGRAALQCTRSIGDADVKAEGVIAEPEVTECRLGPEDEFLVVASDGLWDVLEPADVSALIRDTVKHPGMVAQRLVTEALTRGSADNVSAAVVFFGGGGSWERVFCEEGQGRGGPLPTAFQPGRENFQLPARDEMMECD